MPRTALLTTAAVAIALVAMPATAQVTTYPAWQSTVKYEAAPSGPRFFSNYAKVTSSIRYDAGTNSYILRDTGSASRTSTFGPANVVGGNANYTVYAKPDQQLTLLNPGGLGMSHVRYGAWRFVVPTGGWQGVPLISNTYFVFGPKTTAADMPRTGGATYTGVLDGRLVNKNGTYFLNGSAGFATTWSTRQLTFSASPVASLESGGGTPPTIPVLTGGGSINLDNASFYAASNSSATWKMDMSGYFYGPAAAELGATFRLSGAGANGNGAIVAKQP
jgi:hypothetical protein